MLGWLSKSGLLLTEISRNSEEIRRNLSKCSTDSQQFAFIWKESRTTKNLFAYSQAFLRLLSKISHLYIRTDCESTN